MQLSDADPSSRYNDHYYWGMDINSLLGNPRGKLNLQGSSKVTTMSFKMVREGPNGHTVVKAPVDLRSADREVPVSVHRTWAEMEKTAIGSATQVEIMVPGLGGKEE